MKVANSLPPEVAASAKLRELQSGDASQKRSLFLISLSAVEVF